MYSVLQWLVRCFVRVVFQPVVEGAARMPDSGPVLVCCRHISNWDPPVLGSFMKRPAVFMAKEELFRFAPLGVFLRLLGAFPVRRGTGDRTAVKTALSILEQGRVLLMFPEGHRRPDSRTIQIERGVGLLAARSRAVILPVVTWGSYRPFGKLRIVFGDPFTLPARAHGGGREQADAAVRLIRERMQALLETAMEQGVDR